MMTWQCWVCAHYRGMLHCDAFPKGIPEDILTGQADHREEYQGDGGVTFQHQDELIKSEVDFTDEIVEEDAARYEAVKVEAMKIGYVESDFEPGGGLYGWSTNELIDFLSDKEQ